MNKKFLFFILLFIAQCNSCYFDGQCSVYSPICITTTSQCGCINDDSCGGRGLCANNKCSCSSDTDCNPPYKCNSLKICAKTCTSSDQCGIIQQPQCITFKGIKICGCASSLDCLIQNPVCNINTASCGMCQSDYDCRLFNNTVCNKVTGSCVYTYTLATGTTGQEQGISVGMIQGIIKQTAAAVQEAGTSGITSIKQTQIVYVSPDGNDTTGTGTIVNQFQTINKALSNISATDRHQYIIYLEPGIYQETILLNPWISIMGSNKDNVAIDGSLSLSSNWSQPDVNGGIYEMQVLRDLDISATSSNSQFYMNNIVGTRIFLTDIEYIALQNSYFNSLNISTIALSVIAYITDCIIAGNVGFAAASGFLLNLSLDNLYIQSLSSSLSFVGAFADYSVIANPTSIHTNIIISAGTYHGFLASGSLVLTSNANSIPYTPFDSAQWSVIPLTVQEALDVLANGGSTPIIPLNTNIYNTYQDGNTIAQTLTIMGGINSTNCAGMENQQYVLAIGPGTYNGALTIPSRPDILIKLSNSHIIGSITFNIDQSVLISCSPSIPIVNIIIQSDGYSTITGNINISPISSAGGTTVVFKLINMYLTGNVIQLLGTGAVYIMQESITNTIMTGSFQSTTSGCSGCTNKLISKDSSFGGTQGQVLLLYLTDTMITGTIDYTSGSAISLAQTWQDTTFTTSSVFTGVSSIVTVDTTSLQSFLMSTTVSTRGTISFVSDDTLSGTTTLRNNLLTHITSAGILFFDTTQSLLYVSGATPAWIVVGSSSPSGLGARTFYVNKAGVTGADGSITNPFLTIKQALDIIKGLTFSATTKYSIVIGPGVYDGSSGEDTPTIIPSNVFLSGTKATFIGVDLNINHPATWTSDSGLSSGLQTLVVTGNLDISFNSVITNAVFYVMGVSLQGTTTTLSSQSNPGTYEFDNVQFTNSGGITQTGGNLIIQNGAIFGTATLSISATTSVGSNTKIYQSTTEGSVLFNAPSTTAMAFFENFAIAGTLSRTSGAVSLTTTSIPAGFNPVGSGFTITYVDGAYGIGYSPLNPTDWPSSSVPTNIYDALNILAGIQIVPSVSQSAYVSKAGVDSGLANGSPAHPYQTISYAITQITDATPTKQYTIFVGPGTYTENLQLPANIFIKGSNLPNTIISGTLSISGASWAVAGLNSAGITDIQITGLVTVDFGSVSSASGKFIIDQCILLGGASFNSFNPANLITVYNSYIPDTILTTSSLLMSTSSVQALTIDGYTGSCTTCKVTVNLITVSVYGATIIDETGTTTSPGLAIDAYFIGSVIGGTLSITGTTQTHLTIASSSLPTTYTIVNNPVIIVTNQPSADMLSYSPGLLDDWGVNPPTTVATALDILSNPQPARDFIIYVSHAGNGNSFDLGTASKPFQTLADAMAFIPATPTMGINWYIYVGPGTYTGVTLKCNTFIVGQETDDTILTGAITLDTTSCGNANAQVVGLSSITTLASTFISMNADVTITLDNIKATGIITVTGPAIGINIRNSVFTNNLIITDISSTILSSTLDGTSTIQTVSVTGITSLIEGGAAGGSGAKVKLTATGSNTLTVNMIGFAIQKAGLVYPGDTTSALQLTGSSTSLIVQASVVSIPTTTFYSGGILPINIIYSNDARSSGYAPGTPSNWVPALSANPTIQEALDQLATVSVITGGSIAGIIYVSTTGTSGGNGAISRPYQTIAQAIAVATTATSSLPIVIMVAPGTYSGAVNLIPNVYIVGFGTKKTIITGTVTLDATFTGASSSGFSNLQLSGVMTGITFPAGAASTGSLLFENVEILSALSVTAGNTGSTNIVNFYNVISTSAFSFFVGSTGTNIINIIASELVMRMGGSLSFTTTGATATINFEATGGRNQGATSFTQTTSGSISLNLYGFVLVTMPSDPSSGTVSLVTTVDSLPVMTTAQMTTKFGTPTYINGATGLAYNPLSTTNWNIVPTTVQQGFDYLSSLVSATSYIVYVDKAIGSDSNPGSSLRPFLTIQHAIDVLATTTTPTLRGSVMIVPNVYTETLTLKPNVFLVGIGFKINVRLIVQVTLDATWTGGSGIDNRAGFENLLIVTGSSLNIDFNSVTSTAGKFYIYDTLVNVGITLVNYANINQFQTINSFYTGTFIQTGMSVSIYNSILTGLTVNANSVGCAANDCIARITLNGVVNSGSTTLSSSPTTTASSPVIQAFFVESSLASLTVTGTNTVTISASIGSLSQGFTITGQTTLTYLDNAVGLAYSPTPTTNWNPQPITVSGALDQLAANTGAPFSLSTSQFAYVTKGGSDTTGTGSINRPFLTIQQAITSAANPASSTVIFVGPGTYIDPFVIPANIYIVGSGPISTIIQGSITLSGLTTGFCGISDIGIDSTQSITFPAGSGRIYVNNVHTTSSVMFTSGASSNQFVIIDNSVFDSDLIFVSATSGTFTIIVTFMYISSSGSLQLSQSSTFNLVFRASGGSNQGNLIFTQATSSRISLTLANFLIAQNYISITSPTTPTISVVATVNSLPIMTTAQMTALFGVPSFTSGATSLAYTPLTSTDWSPQPQTVQVALDQLASVIGAPFSSASSQLVYVTKGGSDTTGTGSIIKPVQSITTALTLVTGTQANPVVIYVGPGVYSGAVALAPYVFIVGSGADGETEITGAVTIANMLGTTENTGIMSARLSGTLTLTYPSGASTSGSLYFTSCVITSAVTITGGDTSSANIVNFKRVSISSALSFSVGSTGTNSITIVADDLNIITGGSLAFTTAGATATIGFTGTGGRNQGATSFTQTTSGSISLNLYGFILVTIPSDPSFGTVNLITSVDSIPTMTTVQMATKFGTPTLLNGATSLAYNPTSTSNWNPSPVTIQTALDQIGLAQPGNTKIIYVNGGGTGGATDLGTIARPYLTLAQAMGNSAFTSPTAGIIIVIAVGPGAYAATNIKREAYIIGSGSDVGGTIINSGTMNLDGTWTTGGYAAGMQSLRISTTVSLTFTTPTDALFYLNDVSVTSTGSLTFVGPAASTVTLIVKNLDLLGTSSTPLTITDIKTAYLINVNGLNTAAGTIAVSTSALASCTITVSDGTCNQNTALSFATGSGFLLNVRLYNWVGESLAFAGLNADFNIRTTSNSLPVATSISGGVLASSIFYINDLQPSITKEYYVSAAAGTVSGPGTQTRPYLTIQQALTAIGNQAIMNIIHVGPGTYSNPITLPGSVTIIGQGASTIITGAIGTLPSWLGSIVNIQQVQISAAITLNFQTAGSASGQFFMSNVFFSTGGTLTVTGATGANTNFVNLENIRITSTTASVITLTDIQVGVLDNIVNTGGQAITLATSTNAVGTPATAWSVIGGYFSGTLAVTVFTGKQSTALIQNIALTTLTTTATGATLTVTISRASIPSSYNYITGFSGVTINVVQDSYSPTTVTNWPITPPSTLQQALDMSALPKLYALFQQPTASNIKISTTPFTNMWDGGTNFPAGMYQFFAYADVVWWGSGSGSATPVITYNNVNNNGTQSCPYLSGGALIAGIGTFSCGMTFRTVVSSQITYTNTQGPLYIQQTFVLTRIA